MLAIVEAYRAGLLQSKEWGSNFLSGIIVGIVALPLAMAFAIACGVKPEQGLYTAIIAGIFVAIFGGTRTQIAGPTGAFIVILANITAHYGISGLQIATLLAGIILILMGILKLGNIIKFIPEPVIVGFTSGIGFIIFVGEWKDFFGLPVKLPLDAHFHQKLIALGKAIPQLDITTTLIALLCILLLIIIPKFLKRIPGPLVAVVVATTLQMIFHFKSVATLGSTFGEIPQKLPQFAFPLLSMNTVVDLIGPAFTIALLGAIESLLSATAADSMASTRHNSNQELIGQGLANIVTPLFGGFAATGAIARTATNIRNGGTSPLAAIVHSLILLLFIIFLAPLATNIPLCALAAILFVVAFNMSDIPHFVKMLKHAPNYDNIVLITTFSLTIFTNLVVGVNVGVILAMLFFMRRMVQLANVELLTDDKLQQELNMQGISHLPSDTLVYLIQGPFFFGVAKKIEHTLSTIGNDPKKIIFRLKDVPFMDISGLNTFVELMEQYKKRGIKVYVCEANPIVTQKLIKIGILNHVEEKQLFTSLSQVFRMGLLSAKPDLA